jgi:hypothetical protein
MAVASNLEIVSVPYKNGNGGFTAFTLDETADQLEVIFAAASAATISRLWCNISSVAGSPTAQLSLQGVTSGGRADGTIKASAGAFVQWSAATGAVWQNLGSTYTCTRGEELAWVLQMISGTSIGVNVRANIDVSQSIPHILTYNNTGAVLARQSTAPIWGYGSSSVPWGNPIKALRNTTWSASGTEYGNVFTLPAFASTYRIAGVRAIVRQNASSTFTAKLYSGGGASATTAAHTSVAQLDTYASATGAYQLVTVPFSETTMTTFNAGDSFRLSINSGSANLLGLQGYDVLALADMDAVNSWAQGCFSTTRAGGNWTDTNTTVYAIWPIFEDLSVNPTYVLNQQQTIYLPEDY